MPEGNPPRSLVCLAAGALAVGTALALWLLPVEAGPGHSRAAARVATPSTATPSTATPSARRGGYVAFVDAVRDPGFDLSATTRRTGVRSYALGHLSAGPDGCTSKWGGRVDQGSNPVANRLGGLRAAGGDVGLVFGGPGGKEPAVTCADPRRLLAAYRRVIGAFAPARIDFEVGDAHDAEVTRRRARAVAALQREALERGRSLKVTFALKAGPSGLAPADRRMLRRTHDLGVEITAVTLLVPFRPGDPENIDRAIAAARAAHSQVGQALAEPATASWQRIGLTPVVSGPGGLTAPDAIRLAAFADHHDLASLSIRGPHPPDAITRTLAGLG